MTCDVTIVNPLGLHARAAARFVHLASRFASAVRVGRGGREIDGKSIMGLLLLSAARGTTITISTDGSDEHDALSTLCALVERGFDEPLDSPGKQGLARDTPLDAAGKQGLARDTPLDAPGKQGRSDDALAQDKHRGTP